VGTQVTTSRKGANEEEESRSMKREINVPSFTSELSEVPGPEKELVQ